jgi:hypothetical protein
MEALGTTDPEPKGCTTGPVGVRETKPQENVSLTVAFKFSFYCRFGGRLRYRKMFLH